MELLKKFFDNERVCCIGLCDLKRKVFFKSQAAMYLSKHMSIQNRNIFATQPKF